MRVYSCGLNTVRSELPVDIDGTGIARVGAVRFEGHTKQDNARLCHIDFLADELTHDIVRYKGAHALIRLARRCHDRSMTAVDGTVDLALTGQNTGDDSCVFIPFCQDNMVIATPVNNHYLNLKQKEQPVVFQDFIKDPVIIREKGSGTKKEMDIFLENAGIEPSSLNVVARMNDLESIKKSIVNGLGFSILSARSVVDLQKTKQILLFPLEESAHKRSFYIVYSKNRILKSHVRQFIHYVKEYYQTV